MKHSILETKGKCNEFSLCLHNVYDKSHKKLLCGSDSCGFCNDVSCIVSLYRVMTHRANASVLNALPCFIASAAWAYYRVQMAPEGRADFSNFYSALFATGSFAILNAIFSG